MSRRGTLVLVLLLGWTTPLYAQSTDSFPLHLALAGMMAAHGADLSTTMYCLGAETCHEANPFFAPLTRHPAAAGAVKMGIAAGTAWVLLRHHEEHPKLVFWTSVGLTAFYTGVVIHNARLGR